MGYTGGNLSERGEPVSLLQFLVQHACFFLGAATLAHFAEQLCVGGAQFDGPLLDTLLQQLARLFVRPLLCQRAPSALPYP